MKRLPKSEARLLKGAAAQAYAEFLIEEAGAQMEAEARIADRVRAIRAEALVNAELEAAKLREMEATINAKMGTYTDPITGETTVLNPHGRGVVNDGNVQRFGTRIGS